MASNLSRFEEDLKALVDRGMLLLTAMQHEQHPDHVEKQIKSKFGAKAAGYIKGLPRFSAEYQSWYSEAKALIRQLTPDRLSDFTRHYERLPSRKVLQWDNYTIEDYLQGLSRSDLVPMGAGIARMEQQVSIVRSAQGRFKSTLFDIRQLVAADLLDSEIEAARVLRKGGFHRAAGAVAGVVLEKHLAQVCEDHGVKVAKKSPTIGDLNDLLKAAGVIDTPQWRSNQFLADLRNLCDHHKGKEPTADQAGDLIDGVAKVVKTIL